MVTRTSNRKVRKTSRIFGKRTCTSLGREAVPFKKVESYQTVIPVMEELKEKYTKGIEEIRVLKKKYQDAIDAVFALKDGYASKMRALFGK